jgi:hypothetical protein
MNHVLFLRAMSFLSACVATTTFTMTPLLHPNKTPIFGKHGFLLRHTIKQDRAEKIEEIRNTPQEEILLRNINLKPFKPRDIEGKDDILLHFKIFPNGASRYVPIAKGPNIPSRLIDLVKSLGVGEELAHLKEDYVLLYCGQDLLSYSDRIITEAIENHGRHGGFIALVRRKK